MTIKSMATDIQVQELSRLGFDFSEEAQFSLEKLDVTRRVQVRDPKNFAPASQVKKYERKIGLTAFPPIIVTKDDWLVDGNTRVAALLNRKDRFSPAIILNEKWEGNTAKRQAEMNLLAACINDTAGIGLTDTELKRAVINGLEAGWKYDQITRDTGLTETIINGIKREVEAKRKMDSLGITDQPLSSACKALGRQELLKLNDEVYRSLVALVRDAGLPVSEIASIGKMVVGAGSDAEKLDILHRQRVDLEPQIRDRRLYGSSSPAASRQLRQHLGFITPYAGNEIDLVEANLSKGEEHHLDIEAAIAVLTRVASLQLVRNSEINREV